MLRGTSTLALAASLCALLLSAACRDRFAASREQLARTPLIVPPPEVPPRPSPDPALGDPWLDGRVLRNVPLPNLPYVAQFVGAECVENPEEYALLSVILLKAEGGEPLQELSNYGLKQRAPDGTFEPPSLEHYPNFSLAMTEVRDVNFDKQPDILLGDSYSSTRGIASYAVWIFDTRNGSFSNSILPRIGKSQLDPEHSELHSKPWEAAQHDAEQVFSFARSPWLAERLSAE